MEVDMVASLTNRQWIFLGTAVIALVGLGATGWIWYSNYRAWHNSKAAPLFAEIDPADGANVYESDLWIRWSSPLAANGRVLWRKAGGLRVQATDAGSGQELLGHLASLSAGSKYEYIVEESDENQTLRSPVRTVNVTSGLAFEPVADQTVEHDYDQTVKLTLRNRGSKPITVAAKALKQFDDLPSDITGYGSTDVPAQIAPNGTLDLRLAVTAADATHDTYEIPIEASGAYATARFHVRMPKVNLSFRVTGEDPNTLAKTILIQNGGEGVSDLSVHAAQANEQEFELQPAINHAQLGAGSSIVITVRPILYLEFQSLKAEIEAAAGGQTVKFPLEFTAPAGLHLIVFRSASTGYSTGLGGYCTNHPNTCSIVPGPQGNGPAPRPQPEDAPVAKNYSVRPRQMPAFMATNGIPSTSTFREFKASLGVRPVAFSSDVTLTLMAQVEGKKYNVGGGIFIVPPCSDEQQAYDAANNELEQAEQRLDQLIQQYQQLEARLNTGGATTQDFQQLANLQQEAKQVEQAIDQAKAKANSSAGSLAKCKCLATGKGCEAVPGGCKGHEYQCKYCDDEARYLRSVYSTVSNDYYQRGDWNEPHTSLTLQLGRLLFHVLPEMWEKLRQQCSPCGDIGGLPLGPYLPPTDTEAGADKYKFFSEIADEVDQQADEYSEKGEDAAKEMARGLKEGWKEPVQKGGSFLLNKGAAQYLRNLAKEFRQLALDPPSSDYTSVAVVETHASAVPNAASDFERIGIAMIDALRAEAEYVKAFTTSLERYQGARSAKNLRAADLQAGAMRNYAQEAFRMALAAAELKYQIEEVFANDVNEARHAIAGRGLSWKQAFEQGQKQASQVSPQNVKDAFREYGITDEDLKSLRRAEADLSFTRFNAIVASHLGSFQIAKLIRDGLKTTGISNTWPEPPDTLGLIRMLRMAESAALGYEFPGRTNSNVDDSALAPSPHAGFLQRLQRRESFTRSHRGWLAAPIEGNTADSSTSSASFYSERLAFFAWHEFGNYVVAAGLDLVGKIVLGPQVIGKGRWPRLAADGNRVAVAWSSTDGKGFIVRLNEGKEWANEIQLTGNEAALSFAPGGSLYAATSTGLWRLNGEHFDRVQDGNYSQPGIAVDKDGKPHVASRQNGRILYDGADVGEGERPSVIIAPDGTVSLAYISKGALLVRSGKGGQWTPTDIIPAKNPSWPTLALDANGGVRLSYIGGADHGPNALWLVRLSDKQPILMPSLAGNVTDAWFTTEFQLNDVRSNYRPHDLLLTVNDVWVKMFQNTVPEGRYLFRLNPYQVFTSSGQPVPNRVAIHSWHMNGGHYLSSSKYQLVVRTAWGEHYAFAANEEEARRSISHERINHDQPDLGIYANAMNLPVEQPKPGRLDLPILIANLGEATSSSTQLSMLGENNKVLATAQIPPLKPGADKSITMPFDYDGKLPQLIFRLENNHDFDPDNDWLTLRLWGPKPTGYDGPEPGMPKVPTELTVKLFDENTVPSSYRVLHGFSERMISKVENGQQFGPLPTGMYRLAVKPFPYEGQEVLFSDIIQHQAGVPQTVQLSSGIKLDAQSAGNIWQWSVVDPANPARIIQWQSGQHPLMALPPGEYQAAMQPDPYNSQRVVWPQKVQVQPGQQVTFKLDSGVRLEMPQQMGPLWRWQLVSFGKPDQVVQWQSGDLRAMVVPPGEYQVAMQPDPYNSQRVVWPQKIQAQAGQTATFTLDTGIRFLGPSRATTNAQFQVVDQNKKTIQWGTGRWGVELVPPGTYSVDVRANAYVPWKTVADSVTVRQGQLTDVRVPELTQ
jgi:hypothetical protein